MYYHNDYNYFKFKDEAWTSSAGTPIPSGGGGNNAKLASIYGLWHDAMRSIKRQPFLLMESTPSTANWWPVSKLKKPGQHRMSSMQAVAHGSNSVQYFQFRKSRGAFEKFHGAVVDHQGGTEPREFQDVKAMGQLLERIDAVTQSDVHAQVALVFDWENRWAIDDAQGPRNKGMHYVEQVQAHYRALWRMGISVDIVDEECDISGYKLVIAPMLYLLREGFEEKLKAFVDQGGTLIGTYHTGIVNDCDLTYLGGWPGAGLMEVFGVWNENIDALWDEERNTLQVGEASYETKDLCALIHPQGAQVLGTYGQDFYKGEAALTVNQYGKGQAYYIASFAEDSFYLDFYQKLAGEPALPRALPQLPPRAWRPACGKATTPSTCSCRTSPGRSKPSPCRRAMWTWRATRRGGLSGPVRQPSVPAEQGVNPGKIPGGNHKTD